MRLVQWTDSDSYIRGAYVRSADPDALARDSGIPCNPPDLDGLDWEKVKRTLHNQLASRELFSWEDVQRAGDNGLIAAILASIKTDLQQLYRR